MLYTNLLVSYAGRLFALWAWNMLYRHIQTCRVLVEFIIEFVQAVLRKLVPFFASSVYYCSLCLVLLDILIVSCTQTAVDIKRIQLQAVCAYQ